MSTQGLSIEVASAEGDGKDAVRLDGPAGDVVRAITDYRCGCVGGVCLQWQYGSGWSELYIHPGANLINELARGLDEVEGIGGPAAYLSDGERDMARRVIGALLREVER